MTYGWAILIIAIVLAALYSLGIFNPNTFAPKASAGSCEVVRPSGPGTTSDLGREGTCTNMLPKYVATFNGHSSYIVANVIDIPTNSSSRTILAWYEESPSENAQSDIFAYGVLSCNDPQKAYFEIYTNGAGGTFNNDPNINAWCTDTTIPVSPNYIEGSWIFVAMEYNGTYQIGYAGYNGKIYKTANQQAFTTPFSLFYIGHGLDRAYFNGSIANVQIYNRALSTNQITALYQEGIGGDPIDLSHLVAWYPLNGNANDYSGNNYNGKATNVGYSSTWYKTYSAP